MKRRLLLPGACSGMVLFMLSAWAQQQGEPLRQLDPHQLRVISGHEARTSLGVSVSFGTEGAVANLGNQAAAATATLPVWTYQTTASQNGVAYSGTIVGTSPTSATTTTVPAVLVPVVLKIKQGSTTYTFDPTAPDTSCLGSGNTAFNLTQSSPLFSNASFTLNGTPIGSTQYADAILKGEFWNSGVSSSGYHLMLSLSTSATLTISVNAGPSGNSTAEVYNLSGGQCGN